MPTLDLRTVIVHSGPEDTLDTIIEWIDCDLIEDEMKVTIRGRTADVDPAAHGWTADPLFVNGNDRITKTCALDDVAATRKRWIALCRAVESVSIT